MNLPRRSRNSGRTGGAAVSASILTLLLLAGPTDTEAQTGVRLIPQVGISAPLSSLGEVRNGGTSLFEAGRKSSTLALGAALEAGNFQSGTSARVQVAYATESAVPVGGFECVNCEARVSLLAATAAATFRPVPRIVLAQPHFITGAGVKRYDFDPRDMGEGDSWSSVLRDQTRFTGQLGAGVEMSLLGFRPQLELTAYLSRFQAGESESGSESGSFQTDLFLMLSLPLGG